MKRALFGVASATAVAVLAGCTSNDQGHDMSRMPTGPSTSNSSTSASAAGGQHNDTDAAFATQMIPHHGQAIEMADMALDKANSTQVKAFASRIKAAQSPEIEKMSGWLEGWNVPVPSTTMSHNQHGMSMPGEMSAAEMAELASAAGGAFDKMWVAMMIRHHAGAVDMSRNVLTNGQNIDVKTLAQSIITSQTAEIAQLQQLLTSL